MQDLNFQLKQLCQRNRDGSFATQRDREREQNACDGCVHAGFQHQEPQHEPEQKIRRKPHHPEAVERKQRGKHQGGAAQHRGRKVAGVEQCDDHDRADVVSNTDGAIVWNTSAQAFYYVVMDENHRPSQVWRHTIGSNPTTDKLILEELKKRE